MWEPSPATIVTGEQISLRMLWWADVIQVNRWLNDPEITRTLGPFLGPSSPPRKEGYLGEVARSENDIVLGIRTTDGRLIGLTGLHAVDMATRQAGFGIFIGEKEEWGHGFGTEATRLMVSHGFEQMSLQSIWLRVLPKNERAIRAYRRVGFQEEGLVREKDPRRKRTRILLHMTLSREDWLSGRESVPSP